MYTTYIHIYIYIYTQYIYIYIHICIHIRTVLVYRSRVLVSRWPEVRNSIYVLSIVESESETAEIQYSSNHS